MAAYGPKFACALVMLKIMTKVCHAASASGYCPARPCGLAIGVEIRYPFRLPDDALGTECYTGYPNLLFHCTRDILYLNFTGNTSYSSDTYKVMKIDYWNQTLSLVPQGRATCRSFDASRFGNLNITNTTTLLLDCANNIKESCTPIPGNATSNVCNGTAAGVNDLGVARWACPMKLNNYKDVAYNSCYLLENDPLIPNIPAASTAKLELQFGGNRTKSFIGSSAPPPAPALPSPPESTATAVVLQDSGKSSKKRIIFGVVAGLIVAIIIFVSSMLYWGVWARYSSSKTADGFRRKHIEKMLDRPTTLYTLKELVKATKNFSDDFKLGSGGFGTVYKGTLDSGVKVAIKRTNRTTVDVDMKGISEQFMNEVTLLSQVNHRNLVRLLGCCLEVEVPLLVYEYVSNGDLFQHLQGERAGMQILNWKKRLQIAIDTAEALRYLHSAAVRPIYHRDVKTSNILLDDRFNVKVADFGISKLVEHGITHVSTVVQGTVGYLDPEYFQNFRLTDKSDVYSFGMVLLELLTSLKPVDFQRGPEDINLKAMALPFIQNRNVEAIVDPGLFDASAYESFEILAEMQRLGELASKCLADKRYGRPTMKEVVAELVAIKGVENRAGHENEMSDIIDHKELEIALVPDSQSSNYTSSSDSSYITRYSNPMASIELVKRQSKPLAQA